MACNKCNKYVSGSGVPFYSAVISETATNEIVKLPTCINTLKCKGLFAVYVPSQAATTTLPVIIADCNGNTAPVYLRSTGAQATAAALIANTTALFTFDHFSDLFYLQD
jgi:hypothetical protein